MSVKIAEVKHDFQVMGKLFPIRYTAWQDSDGSYRITEKHLYNGDVRAYTFGSFDALDETWQRIAHGVK